MQNVNFLWDTGGSDVNRENWGVHETEPSRPFDSTLRKLKTSWRECTTSFPRPTQTLLKSECRSEPPEATSENLNDLRPRPHLPPPTSSQRHLDNSTHHVNAPRFIRPIVQRPPIEFAPASFRTPIQSRKRPSALVSEIDQTPFAASPRHAGTSHLRLRTYPRILIN